MSWYNFFKLLHILSVVMMVGGMFARQVVRGLAKKSDDIKAIESLTKAAMRLDRAMVIPGGNLVLVFGIILAVMLKWPIFGFLQGASQNWLLVSNILLILAMVLVGGVFIPYNKRLDSIIQADLAHGQASPKLSAALNDRTNKWAHLIEEIDVIAIAALMVLKPF
ncbi:MAG TPA: DUF2269 family protein [Anaerolineales bacterium]|nr:DUF2269 family protein [Anaerolineales bacterium]